VVTFWDQQIFADSSNKLIWPETVIKANIIRQMSPQEKNKMNAITNSIATVIIATGLFSFFSSFFLEGILNKLIDMLKRVQIIVYTMLIQVYLVAHAEDFIETLF